MRKLKLKELNRLSVEEYKQTSKIPLVIVCDNIRSALNAGSIFRTADALGCEKVVLCGITATPPSRELHKSAIGATDSVDWEYVEHTSDALELLKAEGYEIVSIEQTDRSVLLEEYSPKGKTAIILGNEVHGVSEEAIALSDVGVEIQQFGTKHSFNVAVCTGIVTWEIGRKLRLL